MDENKKPGDTNQEDSFNEDFDFGESESEPRIVSSGEKKAPNKNLLMGIFVVAVATVGVLGYKYLGSSSKPTDAQKEASIKAAEPPAAAPTIAKETPERVVPPKITPTPPPQASVTAPETKATPPGSTTPPSGQEQNFGDLAQAFSSADQTPQSPPSPPAPIPPTAAKDGTIQELQKELFAPERPATATPPAGAVAPIPGPTAPIQPGTQTSTTAANAAKKAETVTSTPAPVPSNEVAQLVDNLHKLNQQIDFISNKIKHLDSYTHEISDNLTKLNETINALDTRVVALTNTTTTLSKDVGSVKNEVGHFKEVLKNEDTLDLSPSSVAPHAPHKRGRGASMDGKISIEEPEYLVHAVIPGRAWLKSARGQILTVTEGDTVGNYGKILVIDAANGVVLTSSGVTFR